MRACTPSLVRGTVHVQICSSHAGNCVCMLGSVRTCLFQWLQIVRACTLPWRIAPSRSARTCANLSPPVAADSACNAPSIGALDRSYLHPLEVLGPVRPFPPPVAADSACMHPPLAFGTVPTDGACLHPLFVIVDRAYEHTP